MSTKKELDDAVADRRALITKAKQDKEAERPALEAAEAEARALIRNPDQLANRLLALVKLALLNDLASVEGVDKQWAWTGDHCRFNAYQILGFWRLGDMRTRVDWLAAAIAVQASDELPSGVTVTVTPKGSCKVCV